LKNSLGISGYRYASASASQSHSYILPTVKSLIDERRKQLDGRAARLFDLGCGNGSVAATFSDAGWDVTGVDPSSEGIAKAQMSYPDLKLMEGSAYSDLASTFGQFPIVVSLEVVEHLYAPRDYARTLFDLVEPGGLAIVSTPYHGYLKNLALAITGKMDAHFTALWDHGHIKFWSIPTLTTLLSEAGFCDIRFHRVGRIPAIAKSMIAVGSKKRC
jgi:2-polyprenyl-6-hydroxyphenyl methylase/3-demethylubiquinone-9 3-methyltransferase